MVTLITVYWGHIDVPTLETRVIQNKILLEAVGAIEDEIPKLKNKLIEDLRGVLAGSSD